MDINININFGDKTAEAINNLADAIKSLTGMNISTPDLVKVTEEKIEKAVASNKNNKTKEPAKDKAPQSITKEPDKAEEKVEEVKQDNATKAEDAPDLGGLNLGSEINYGAEELRKATADLAGASPESKTAVIKLLKEKYNVAGFNNIDSSRYGEYAADIRALGANI